MQERWDEAVGLLTCADPSLPMVLPPASNTTATIMRACSDRGDAVSAVAVFHAVEPVYNHCVLLIAIVAFSALGDWQGGCALMTRQLSLPLASTEPEAATAVMARLLQVTLRASSGACQRGDTGMLHAVAGSAHEVRLVLVFQHSA